MYHPATSSGALGVGLQYHCMGGYCVRPKDGINDWWLGRPNVDQNFQAVFDPFSLCVDWHFEYYDNKTRPHRSHVAINFQSLQGVRTLPWPTIPPNPSPSPNMSPLVHIWDVLEQQVRNRPSVAKIAIAVDTKEIIRRKLLTGPEGIMHQYSRDNPLLKYSLSLVSSYLKFRVPLNIVPGT